ncbi:hypothetical protein DPMN_105780 [Dreissena polymorpha]|uniref:Uncharacterized protein n=1 Tax=Dreissena polymorpha TaxID=45954 RepID=A0A9D4K3U2_DREPO|nr:hypothetical protein DPMN_105780 [Dreissena polymorpha]
MGDFRLATPAVKYNTEYFMFPVIKLMKYTDDLATALSGISLYAFGEPNNSSSEKDCTDCAL